MMWNKVGTKLEHRQQEPSPASRESHPSGVYKGVYLQPSRRISADSFVVGFVAKLVAVGLKLV